MSFPSPNKATRMLTNSSISSQGSPKYAAESLNACLNDECFDSNNKSTVAPKALESTFFDINSIKSYLETKCGAVSEYLLSIDEHSPVPDIVAESSKWNFKSQILNGKFINYAYLCRVICNTKEDCVDWLKEMDLIVKTMVCPTCGFEMKIKKMPRLSDGAIWFCSNVTTVKRKSCSKRCSIRRGSWFELTNITLEQILAFCYMWINGFSQDQIISESGISAAAYVWLNKFCTRVCKEILFDDKSDNKMEQLSSAQILDAWLNSCGDEDSFVRLLKNAAVIHQQDNTKHSIP
ncbi:uncharacterized protein LOC129218129 isoform X2 [Uloborus diversus]|uniref:uncharacterized protein LOC129218129 isoform X2 n=1 Tax=Uloborus diversus TaxID=327109 RepID=UPI0024091668|nr:uncharacterized protein LOC129218129 isoform X2 [Uloborus diversus]